jgi:hypothetical protein
MIAHFPGYDNILCDGLANSGCIDKWKQANKYTHPDDMKSIYKAEIIFYNLLKFLPLENKKHFSMWYLRRMMNKSGGYDIYLISVFMLEADGQGGL